MIYNSRNRSNDTTESHKEKKTLFYFSFSVQSVKNQGTKLDVVIKNLCYVEV